MLVGASKSMRRLIASAFSPFRDLDVVGTTSDAEDAQSMIRYLTPDVVILCVEMSNGGDVSSFGFLAMQRSTPLVVVSSMPTVGKRGSASSRAGNGFDPLSLASASISIGQLAELPNVVRGALGDTESKLPRPQIAPKAPKEARFGDKIILIGASTGGVEALTLLLRSFPANCPPTLIVQHMPESFSKGFASHLNDASAAEVLLAEDRAPLREGHVIVAPGGAKHLTLETSGGLRCRLKEGPKLNGHSPSVDALFLSAVAKASRTVGVILTGIGHDGAAGLASLRKGGARTIGQSMDSCVVYGMPRAARKVDAVETELPISQIAQTALGFCKQTTHRL